MNFLNAILLALLLLIPQTTKAASAPFIPELDAILNDDNPGSTLAQKFVKLVYNVAVTGGDSVEHDMGITFPAGSLIMDVLVYINAEFADSGTSSLRIKCGSSALTPWMNLDPIAVNKILHGKLGSETYDGTNIFGVHAWGIPLSAPSIPEACSLIVEVRSDAGYVPVTAGKFTAIIEYFDKE